MSDLDQYRSALGDLVRALEAIDVCGKKSSGTCMPLDSVAEDKHGAAFEKAYRRAQALHRRHQEAARHKPS